LPADLIEAGIALISLSDAMNQADVLVLLVDHQEFKRVPPANFHSKTVVDTRGIWP
jgi:UDP-N-acetyl-D-mannosaminuronic acid dehydrogenase